MSKETFDQELNLYLDSQPEEYECTECSNPVTEEGTQCSSDCNKTSER